jgi:ABC-type uncharacterized transport system substrate-binding protein
MRRREFITLLVSAATARPLSARAQQPAMPVIGFLNTAFPAPFAHLVAAFRKGLRESGFVEGQNVAIEYRWAEGQYAAAGVKDVQEAAATLGVRLIVANASTAGELEPALATLATQGIGALIVGADPFFNSQRFQLSALVASRRIPAIYEFKEFAVAGGLMSYGTSLSDAYQQVGTYIGRILKGTKPTDLPVVQATRFEFVINLKVANSLGIVVPPGLSARADEVIE